jgi:bifunctional non-homologous end joining protein LigD
MKTGASLKPLSAKRDDESVKTGRSMAAIAGARDAEWQSNRQPETSSATANLKTRIKAALKKKGNAQSSRVRSVATQPRRSRHLADLSHLPSAKPRFIDPMKARLVEQAPMAGDWSYELKFDGFRACAVKSGNKVSLFSRNQNELHSRFPEIADAVKELSADECVIDGEIVALDQKGRSSFQLLQAIELEGRQAPLRFYVFDLLQLDRKSLLPLPLTARKSLLEQLCDGANQAIRYSGEIGRDAKPLLAQVKRLGLEGLIGKLRDSVYEPGRRSGTWIKLKSVNEQEFVIGGYTPPAGSRKHFGAILVGYYDKGRLLFAGKTGTGFNETTLAVLHGKFRQQQRDTCPFVDLPSKQGGKWVQGITPSMMNKMHWINPVFVAQIKFAEWTRDAKLRQPVFLGLREDKDPKEVKREG